MLQETPSEESALQDVSLCTVQHKAQSWHEIQEQFILLPDLWISKPPLGVGHTYYTSPHQVY